MGVRLPQVRETLVEGIESKGLQASLVGLQAAESQEDMIWSAAHPAYESSAPWNVPWDQAMMETGSLGGGGDVEK